MKQRASVARSLILKPKILLLDEPFSALDEAMKREFQEMMLGLYQENLEAKKKGEDPPYTVIMITHSIDQAFYVSDRIIGLSKNWKQQLGKGEEVVINGLPRAGRVTGELCGATKMWDKSAPVYHPDDPRDFDLFFAAQQELDKVVLKEDAPTSDRNEHVNFWSDLEQGVGTGVTMLRSHV
jgi:NitT/TauT family transport system ATP-binding protein